MKRIREWWGAIQEHWHFYWPGYVIALTLVYAVTVLLVIAHKSKTQPTPQVLISLPEDIALLPTTILIQQRDETEWELDTRRPARDPGSYHVVVYIEYPAELD